MYAIGTLCSGSRIGWHNLRQVLILHKFIFYTATQLMSYRVFYGNFAFFFGNHSGQYCFHFLGLLLSNSIFQSYLSHWYIFTPIFLFFDEFVHLLAPSVKITTLWWRQPPACRWEWQLIGMPNLYFY